MIVSNSGSSSSSEEGVTRAFSSEEHAQPNRQRSNLNTIVDQPWTFSTMESNISHHGNGGLDCSEPCALLYNVIRSRVKLRPTAPATFRNALRQNGEVVHDLTLLGFSETATDELLAMIKCMPYLRKLSIVSLDLWSSLGLQSRSALAVGPALGVLCVDSLQVLHLNRVCMGRSPKHVRAFAETLRNHPSLKVLCMDTHSTKTHLPSTDNEILILDTLLDALSTCSHLKVLQIYLSAYQRGILKDSSSLALLVQQLQELSLHMVSIPGHGTHMLTQAMRQTHTLQRLHWTTTTTSSSSSSFCWEDLLKANSSLTSVSLSVPLSQRPACWQAISNHPQISSACLSFDLALRHVPAFVKIISIALDRPNEEASAAEFVAMTDALLNNARLVHVESEYSTCVEALVEFNQGPRYRYLNDPIQWWGLLDNHIDNLDALWLLLRLNPSGLEHKIRSYT